MTRECLVQTLMMEGYHCTLSRRPTGTGVLVFCCLLPELRIVVINGRLAVEVLRSSRTMAILFPQIAHLSIAVWP